MGLIWSEPCHLWKAAVQNPFLQLSDHSEKGLTGAPDVQETGEHKVVTDIAQTVKIKSQLGVHSLGIRFQHKHHLTLPKRMLGRRMQSVAIQKKPNFCVAKVINPVVGQPINQRIFGETDIIAQNNLFSMFPQKSEER